MVKADNDRSNQSKDNFRAEQCINNSERRLAEIIDFLPDATFVIDKEGIVISWNRAMEDLTGIRAMDILGKGDYEYAVPFYGVKRLDGEIPYYLSGTTESASIPASTIKSSSCSIKWTKKARVAGQVCLLSRRS